MVTFHFIQGCFQKMFIPIVQSIIDGKTSTHFKLELDNFTLVYFGGHNHKYCFDLLLPIYSLLNLTSATVYGNKASCGGIQLHVTPQILSMGLQLS